MLYLCKPMQALVFSHSFLKVILLYSVFLTVLCKIFVRKGKEISNQWSSLRSSCKVQSKLHSAEPQSIKQPGEPTVPYIHHRAVKLFYRAARTVFQLKYSGFGAAIRADQIRPFYKQVCHPLLYADWTRCHLVNCLPVDRSNQKYPILIFCIFNQNRSRKPARVQAQRLKRQMEFYVHQGSQVTCSRKNIVR